MRLDRPCSSMEGSWAYLSGLSLCGRLALHLRSKGDLMVDLRHAAGARGEDQSWPRYVRRTKRLEVTETPSVFGRRDQADGSKGVYKPTPHKQNDLPAKWKSA